VVHTAGYRYSNHLGCSSGAISVFQEDDPNHFRKLADVSVQRRVHSLAVDIRTHRVYVPEQEEDGRPAHICVRDAQGNVLARMESRHVHGVGVDSRGDIYAGLTQDRSVDKFVRTG